MRNLVLVLVLIAGSFFPAAAQKTLEGVIRDGKGQPVEGASILLKGTKSFAVASASGKFKLQVSNVPPITLQISSVGYSPADVVLQSLPDSVVSIVLIENNQMADLVITSRRRIETVQQVPIAISVVGGKQVEDAGAFNVNRLKELVPTVQLYSSNPRNTTLNIRGLGSTFGLTNDGIDPGVGFYVDGVYYARPAATTLDFVDVDRIEVLRGPQGTLFGKNTTAGAFNISARGPKFTPGAQFEVSYGNYGFIQAKASVTGPLSKKLAGRISFSGTQRDGVIYNVATQQHVNDLNNLGFRGQLLYKPNDRVKITFIGDFTDQNPNGYAQVLAGVVKTQRAAYRQFDSIVKDLNYRPVSLNAFDRLIDHNTPWKSGNQLGGLSVNADIKIGPGTLTSTTAWRFWNWDPSNDRDFTGLSVLSLSQATSKHQQWTQEFRYAGDITANLSGVVGAFFISQDLKTDPEHIEESGSAQWRFSQSTTSPLWKTPGLFDGYGIKTTSRLKSTGAAVFAQVDWAITPKFHVLPGIRYNYDAKDVNYDRVTYGGLQTTNPQLLALKRLVYTDQAFVTDAQESNFSGGLTVSYKPTDQINAFATYSISYKPVGVNLGGLPTANGEVLIELARIKPENVRHYEFGVKTTPTKNTIFNIVFHHTEIKDYQTQVQTAEVGVNRGYLANAEKVRVWGIEVDANSRINSFLSVYGNLAYTDGIYVSFTNAPVPLEETGAPSAFKDISGGVLPGISKWTGSFGGELSSAPRTIMGSQAVLFFATDVYARSSFSSSPSPSKYLNVDGYLLVNARAGFKANAGVSIFVWARNIFNADYYEQLLPAAGNAGHYAGVLGDPRTYGVTLRYNFSK